MKTVVFDLDGTLSHYEKSNNLGKAFSQEVFNEQAKNLKPNKDVIEILQHYKASGYFIVVLTARPEHILKEITLQWLQDNGIVIDSLIMLPQPDYEHSRKLFAADIVVGRKHIGDFKVTAIKRLMDEGSNVVAFFDDCSENIRKVHKKLNITTLQVKA